MSVTNKNMKANSTKIPQIIKNKIVGEANWRSTNGHGGVDDVTRDNFIQAAEYGYNLWLQSQQPTIADGWISVEDRLPDYDEFVLWYDEGYMFVAEIDKDDPSFKDQQEKGIKCPLLYCL